MDDGSGKTPNGWLFHRQACDMLAYTGERMVPEKADPSTFWEHIYRYKFAARLVRNRRVLDIACGEGYGAAALAQAGASRVVGVDISLEACAYARRKYGIDARVGDASRLPLPDTSIDVIVSFETLEHIGTPQTFLSECARVLSPEGLFIISTPNRDAFRGAGRHSHFHCSELTRDEFMAALTPRFKTIDLYAQMPMAAGWWSIRSLAAVVSPWFAAKGSWRVRELLRKVLCPHVRGEVSQAWRMDPVAAVLSRDRPLSSVVNPFVVRRWSPWCHEWPMYMIAVARA